MNAAKLPALVLALVFLLVPHGHALPWRTGGPQGGAIEALSTAPSDPDRLYVGTRRGLFRSDDGGGTWSKVGNRAEDVFLLTADPVDPDTLFIVTADAVYRSDDGGAVWTPLDVPSGVNVSALLIDPRNRETIYIGSRCEPFFKMSTPLWHESAGVFKSTDGGVTWDQSNDGLTGFQQCVEQLAIDPVSPDTLYATPIYSDNGYARSDDGGETWTTVDGRLPGGSVTADPADPSRRYGTTSYGGAAHFLVSGDAGRTWTATEPQLLGDGPLDSYWYGEVTTDPRNGRMFLATDSGAYRSGDGGMTWLPLEGPARDSIRGIELDPSSGALTIGTNNGLFRSAGYPWDQWEELGIPFVATGALEIVQHPSAPTTLFAMGGNRIYRTDDLGRTWTNAGDIIPSTGDRAFIAYDLEVDAAGDLYVMGFSGTGNQLLRLEQETGQWRRLSPPPSPFDHNSVTIRSMTADPRLPGEIYVGQVQEIAHSVDGGETWEHLPIPHSYLEDLAIDPVNSDTIWAATGDGIMKSLDRGRTWSVSRVLDHTSELVPQKIVISRSDPSVVYFFTRFFGPVGRTTNGGESWTTVVVPGDLTDLAISARDPELIFASTLTEGVFRSRNAGDSWEQIGQGLPPGEQFRSIAVDDLDAFIHVGTWSYGAWELPLGGEFRRRPVTRR